MRDTEADFLAELERQTVALQNGLPSEAQQWGTARKGLNLFLGEVYYHRILCPEFGFAQVGAFLEVPLDKDVTQFLRGKAAALGTSLPRWTTIKRLRPEVSKQYQKFAREYAETCGEGWLRLHIDLLAWRIRPENDMG